MEDVSEVKCHCGHGVLLAAMILIKCSVFGRRFCSVSARVHKSESIFLFGGKAVARKLGVPRPAWFCPVGPRGMTGSRKRKRPKSASSRGPARRIRKVRRAMDANGEVHEHLSDENVVAQWRNHRRTAFAERLKVFTDFGGNHNVSSVQETLRCGLQQVPDLRRLKEHLNRIEMDAARACAKEGNRCRFCQNQWSPWHRNSKPHRSKVEELA